MKTQPGWLIPTWGKRTLLIFQQGTGKHQDWQSTKEQPGKQTHTWEGAKPREELACTAHKRHRESQQSPGSHFQRTQKPLESGRELQESPGNCLKRTKSHQVRQGITRITWKSFPGDTIATQNQAANHKNHLKIIPREQKKPQIQAGNHKNHLEILSFPSTWHWRRTQKTFRIHSMEIPERNNSCWNPQWEKFLLEKQLLRENQEDFTAGCNF